MLKSNKIILFFLIALSFVNSVFAQNNTTNKATPGHRAGKFVIGINAGIGYNVINHVDGTLAVIPNNADPNPSPGTPVYSHPISLSIDAPFLSTEYWFTPSWSLKVETGLNMFMVGARHALADFAYLLPYWKVNTGARYYFTDVNVNYLFVGAGWFANFPILPPYIGFIESKGKSYIDTGPYAEIGVNYPITEGLTLEAFGRFYFGIRAMTRKSDPNFLTEIALSPFDIGLGLSWTIL